MPMNVGRLGSTVNHIPRIFGISLGRAAVLISALAGLLTTERLLIPELVLLAGTNLQRVPSPVLVPSPTTGTRSAARALFIVTGLKDLRDARLTPL
jgi:hypothetical protein